MVNASCIIPTFNRQEVLIRTLQALVEQSYSGDFEVLIINDGSQDNTGNAVNNFIQKSVNGRINWRYFYWGNKGPAAARNLGIKNAAGKFIIFLGDDTIPDRDLIERHINLLETKAGICSLGVVVWHPESKNINSMAYRIAGIEIDYGSIRSPQDCDFTYFCTANVALEKKYFLNDHFDEDFPFAAMEDTELAYRLALKGLRFVLNDKAITRHLHRYNEEGIIKRQENIGKSVAILIKKHPQLKARFVKPNAKLLFLLCSVLAKLKFLRYINQDFYLAALSTYSKYRFCR